MNKTFVVTNYDPIEEEYHRILGTFGTSVSAILFIKYLMREGVEGYFDVDMVEPLSMAENINRFKEEKSVSTIIATTLHASINKYGEIYIYPSSFSNEEVIDLLNSKEEIK